MPPLTEITVDVVMNWLPLGFYFATMLISFSSITVLNVSVVANQNISSLLLIMLTGRVLSIEEIGEGILCKYIEI